MTSNQHSQIYDTIAHNSEIAELITIPSYDRFCELVDRELDDKWRGKFWALYLNNKTAELKQHLIEKAFTTIELKNDIKQGF
jgi:hypothetical protein